MSDGKRIQFCHHHSNLTKDIAMPPEVSSPCPLPLAITDFCPSLYFCLIENFTQMESYNKWFSVSDLLHVASCLCSSTYPYFHSVSLLITDIELLETESQIEILTRELSLFTAGQKLFSHIK